MTTLYLLRHAKAEPGGASLPDHDRPLAERGRRNARALAAWLRDRREGPPALDLVLCSTARRARETLEPLLAIWPAPPPVLYERGLYLCGPSAILMRLQRLAAGQDRVLVVGHNPDFHQLATWAAGSGADAALAALREKYPTGALAVIDFGAAGWRDVEAGSGRLTTFMPPRNLP
jgi:phosphohistidine phosphatase